MYIYDKLSVNSKRNTVEGVYAQRCVQSFFITPDGSTKQTHNSKNE